MKPEILNTITNYSSARFRADLIAGLTVAMVAIPLSLAIAIASGASPETGLFTAVVGGFMISLLGGSRVQIGGPTGAFIVVVYGVIAEYGFDGLVLASIMAGVILLIAGLLRAGNLIVLIPEPVINGFTVGIAIIIATSQIKDLFGLELGTVPANFLDKLPVMWAARGSFNPLALVFGVSTIVAIVVLRRVYPRFPGLILAVATASLIAAIAGADVDTIFSRFGSLPSTLPAPSLPHLSIDRAVELLPSAIVIAFLAGVESLLSALVGDQMTGDRHRPNAELIAQGVANLASAAVGGLPATGAIARTATNIRAGGQTPVAGIVHSLVILATLFLAAPLAGYLVLPALSGLLILTAWNMSEPHKWAGYLTGRASDIFLFAMTCALTVLADLTIAIGSGVAVGLALRLRRRGVPPADWTPPER